MKSLNNGESLLDQFTRCKSAHAAWNDTLNFYHESIVLLRETKLTLIFIEGMHNSLTQMLSNERLDLINLNNQHKSSRAEPTMPLELRLPNPTDRIESMLIHDNNAKPNKQLRDGSTAVASGIDANSNAVLAQACCQGINETIASLTTADPGKSAPLNIESPEDANPHIVAACNQRQGGPGRPKRTLCEHAGCGRWHLPNTCCLCGGPHQGPTCWHVAGCPESAQQRIDSFKQLKSAGLPPFDGDSPPASGNTSAGKSLRFAKSASSIEKAVGELKVCPRITSGDPS